MIIRKWLQFSDEFPDDGVVENNDWSIFPGKTVATAIGELLTNLGCDVKAPEHQFEHGWDFHFHLDRVRFWCQVCRIEDYLIVVELRSGFDFLGKKKSLYADVLTRLNNALKQDGRFHNIRWFTQQELDDPAELPGSPEPVAA